MIIPEEITILKHKIKVIHVRTLDGKFGLFDPVKNEIKIALYVLSDDEEVALSPTQILHTFWHEVFHVFQWFYEGGFNEGQSQAYAGFMLEFFGDESGDRKAVKEKADAANDCGAVPAEKYRGHDYMLFGLKQQIERGDTEALRLARKMKEDALRHDDPELANAINRMLNKYYNEQTNIVLNKIKKKKKGSSH